MIFEQGSSSRQGRILIASLTVVAAALVGAVSWYYVQQRNGTEAAAIRELSAIADVKARQLASWRRERLGDGRVLASPLPMRAARNILAGRASAAEQSDLTEALRALQSQFLYSWAGIVEKGGAIRLETGPLRSNPARLSEYVRAATQTAEVSLQDLYVDPVLKRPLMDLVVPVDGQGAFVLEIDPERFLYPYITSWPVPSETAESLLVRLERDEAVYLNELRNREGTALSLRRPVSELPILSRSGTARPPFRGRDYRGVEVLNCVRQVSNSPWYLITKIDTREVDAPVRRLAWELGILVALIAALNAAGAGLIWRDQQLRTVQDREIWFRKMTNETPAYLWMSNAQGENTFINKPLAELLGTAQQSLGSDWLGFVHPEERETVASRLSNCVLAECEYLDECRVRRFDGQYRWMLIQGRASRDAAGRFTGYRGAMLDLTERRLAEQAARESAELIRGCHEVLERIARGAPLRDSLDLLLRFVETHSADMLASILLVDEDGIHLRHAAAPSLPEEYMRAIDGAAAGPAAGSCGTAVYLRRPVVTEDIATDPRWDHYRELALKYGLRACWSTPVFDDQRRLIGTFALYFRNPRRPGKRDWEMIAIATHTAAIAIIRDRETEALRQSENRLRLAVTSANIGIWEWDSSTDRLIWSDEMRAMVGWPEHKPEPPGSGFWDLVHKEEREHIKKQFEKAVALHADFEAEYRIVRDDGAIRWIAAHARTNQDEKRTTGVALDITARKEAEENIRKSEVRLREAQAIAHLGSYEWDIAANTVYRSPELCRIFGLSPAEFPPTYEAYLERVHPEDRNKTKQNIEQAFRERSPYDQDERIVRADGVVRILRSQGRWQLDEQGQPVRLMGTCQDLTDQRRADQELRAANTALADELKERTRARQEIQALSARLINAQEEERTRLARELHDDVSQQIAALSIATSNMKRGLPRDLSSIHGDSDRIQTGLARLAEGVRRLSHELHPAVLQYSGLAVALRKYCSELEALTGMKVGFQAEGCFDNVAPPVALCCYRIAQEALQNVGKHAGVNAANVVLRREGGLLSLSVSDHGAGMAPQMGDAPAGLGLISIRERARLVNGTVEIESRQNEGTRVTLKVRDGASATL